MHSIILGTKVNKITREQALKKVQEFLSDKKQHYIVTPNPEICLYASQRDKYEYRRYILSQADLSLPDGIGLIFASFILGQPIWRRISGSDFIWDIAKIASNKNLSIFLAGGEKHIAGLTAQNLQKEYPKLKIAGLYDGLYKNTKLKNFTRKQMSDFNNLIIKQINRSQADILLVAFGAPEQEQWIAQNLSKLPKIKLAMAVGGSFDFISKKIKRAPKLLRIIGLEWLWRLYLEPKRIKRIFNATFKFLGTVILWRLRIFFIYRKSVVGLIRLNNKYLIVERADEFGHWQLPQGGIDKAETIKQAGFREMQEELGLNKSKLKLQKIYPNFYKYTWTAQTGYAYKGQKQNLAVFEFLGKDQDIKLDQKELRSFKWVSSDNLLESVHEYRKEMINKIVFKISNCSNF